MLTFVEAFINTMKKLGLDKKYNEEIARQDAQKDELILKLQAQIEALTSSLKESAIECEQLKQNNEQKDEIIDAQNEFIKKCLTEKTGEDKATDFFEKLEAYWKELAELRRKVNYLSLNDTKKSERQNRPQQTDENPSAASVSKDKGSTQDKDDEFKHRKQGMHNGNNNAKHNLHESDDIETVIKNLIPEGCNTPDWQLMAVRTENKYDAKAAIEITRVEYHVFKYKNVKTGEIRTAEIPATPLKGSHFMSGFLALLLYLKYDGHMTVDTICSIMKDSGFNISKKTLNGLINKLSRSQFFKNLDRTLFLAIIVSGYIQMDETFLNAMLEVAKREKKFIKQFWIWVMIAMDIGLIRFSSNDGSRKDSIGYELVQLIKAIVQSDAKTCYKNMEKNIFPNIIRIACIQHVKRYFLKLADYNKIAKEIVDLYNELYIMDHKRVDKAKEDLINGIGEWTLQDHINWRKKHAPPILKKIQETLERYSNDETILPSSKLGKAIRHALSEMNAVKAIFEQEKFLCKLDNNPIELKNRAISKFRKVSKAFGSVKAGELQCIFFSLVESCHLQGVNVFEYLVFLLEKMPTMPTKEDCIIEDRNSTYFDEYRKLLPDEYAKSHQTAKKKNEWHPVFDKFKPLLEKSKRKAYTKREAKLG